MKVFSFPYVIKSDDLGSYLLDCDTETAAKELVKKAEDYFGYCAEDAEPEETDVAEDSAIYDALSSNRYESAGFNTRDELFKAYEELTGDSDCTAYSIDNVESAVIGVTDDFTRFVYDYDLLIKALMSDDIDEISAIEWYEFNIERSFPYYQPSPIILRVVDI